MRLRRPHLTWLSLIVALAALRIVAPASQPVQAAQETPLWKQAKADVDAKSAGCVTCHSATDSASMHPTETVQLGCTDCHGGNPQARIAPGTAATDAKYGEAKMAAHVQPTLKDHWKGSANPQRAYTEWLRESPEYIQFVNPGDLRVADRTCGMSGCHVQEVRKVRTSMMTHGAMLWGAALYNNGGFPYKNPHFGESYDREGKPQRLQTWPPPSAEETKSKGVLPYLEPLQRWEYSQPGNVLRVFERGGGKREEIGNPGKEDPGRPDAKLSDRGFGTSLRTDPVFLGLQKTRLLDPLLYLPGTNDQPGDYRGSGCTGCHVLYANDRDAAHSGSISRYGNNAETATVDPTIPRHEPGHPLKHVFTRAIPSSQCMICHVHPGTNMMTTYYGYTWWDNEVDADKMYPAEAKKISAAERRAINDRNPEASTPAGLWSDVEFLKKVGTPEFNAGLQHTQFADFHSHGWIFRAVFKRDREGNLLDEEGKIVRADDPERFRKAVQLKDIHLEKGMHCVDCHFEQDSHGNAKLYGEPRAAIEISCVDCHGTIGEYTKSVTSGPAAPEGGNPLERLVTPWKEARFYKSAGKFYQRSVVEQGKQWEIVQVKDTVTPGNAHFSEKSRYAKLLRKDGLHWGTATDTDLAHSNSRMTCFACHSSWTSSCFGCHLEMTTNQKSPMLHNEGLVTRNWTSYNFDVLRSDVYMLGVDGTVTGNRIAPVRSSCAVVVSSQNQNRAWQYYGQQTVSSEGFSGQAFSTYVPHTVRARETKTCSDCHVSSEKNNNAWMAQVLVQGTNFLNYMGKFAYVATGNKGFEAITVADQDEPLTVIGSDFEKTAHPDRYAAHVKRGLELDQAHEHPGTVLDVQLRGEYLYAAMGSGGLRVFDVANIDNKDFSEHMTTAPVSPIGQRLYVKTKYAQAVASPSTLAVDPTRRHLPVNEEQAVHLLYGFLYVADKYEGLVIVGDARPDSPAPGVSTLLDGEPRNNFLRRALAFNPEGKLNGARRITLAGTYAYILCDAGLVVVDLNDPQAPKITATIGAPDLTDPQGIAVQFRYAFVVDKEGLKVLDVTHLERPQMVRGVTLPLADARNIYVARTYAYIAGGSEGMVIADVERPEQPKIYMKYNQGGELSDTRDIKIGMVSSSQFAFVADGKNGFKVVQLFSPETTSQFYGFSPPPIPKLIARKETRGPALIVSKGVDRDRAVDESGNQLAVFGRRGARPFNREEMERMYLRNGVLYTVSDTPPKP